MKFSAIRVFGLLSVLLGFGACGLSDGSVAQNVTAPAVTTIVTDQATYSPTQSIGVTWTGMPGDPGDFVAIVTAGSPPDSGFISWTFTGGQVDGTTAFSGVGAGAYEARAYQHDSFTVLASSPFTVMATTSPSIMTDQASYSIGQPVTLTWAGMPGNANDWIAVVTAGSPPDSGFVQWNYIGGQTAGSMVFNGIPTGNFEARGYLNGSFTVLATSNFSVNTTSATIMTDQGTYALGQPVTVSWAGMPGNANDWVAIATAGSPPDSGIVRWDYINGQVSGSMVFNGIPAGAYEARAYLNGSYTILATSTFDIANAALCTSATTRPVLSGVVSGDLVLDATQTENMAAMSVPLATSILFTSIREAEPSPTYGMVMCFLAAGGVTCDRQSPGTDYAGSTGQITIHYTVVTFTSGVTVQRGTANLGFTNPSSIALTTVDPTQSFVILNGGWNGGTGWGNNEFVQAQLLDAQTLDLQTNTPGTNASWQVVSMVGSSVQRGTTNFASADTQQQATIADAPTGSVVFSSYTSDNAGGAAAATLMLATSLSGPTTVSFSRDQGGSALAVSWEVVSLPFATHAGLASFGPGQTTQTVPVSNIVGSSSVGVCSSQGVLGQSSGSTTYAGADLDLVGEAAVTLTTGTNSVVLTRASSLATAEIPWTVIDFAHDCTGL